jgi:membrane protein YdbS with pleckstrin-like domain
MAKYTAEYFTAREEAEWLTLRVKFYTLVVGGGVLTVALAVLVTLLGIFVAPEALIALMVVMLVGIIPCFSYSEYGQNFHTERILRRRQAKEEREMLLAEAERIVNAFGKGK